MPDFLFVYGTLRSGFDNPFAARLRAESEFIGPDRVPGAIYRLGSYPGYRPHPGAEVHGELYLLSQPAPTLAALDAYEGEEFERVEILTLSGARAWIYRWVFDPPPAARIESGDFTRP